MRLNCKQISTVKTFGSVRRKRKKRPGTAQNRPEIGDYRTEYLRSAHWRETRLKALKRAKYLCKCGNRAIDVHHKTYANIGHEYARDLVALCRPCHDAIHRLK